MMFIVSCACVRVCARACECVSVVVCANRVHQVLNARASRFLCSTAPMAANHTKLANNPLAESLRHWSVSLVREHLQWLGAFGPGRASDHDQVVTPRLRVQKVAGVQLLLLLLLILTMQAWASLGRAVKLRPLRSCLALHHAVCAVKRLDHLGSMVLRR